MKIEFDLDKELWTIIHTMAIGISYNKKIGITICWLCFYIYIK